MVRFLGIQFGKTYADGEFCPDVRGACVGRACKAWQNVQGKDPQSGAHIDRWECVKYVWAPKLQVEAIGVANSIGAAVESARNENTNSIGRLANAIVNRPILVPIIPPKVVNE